MSQHSTAMLEGIVSNSHQYTNATTFNLKGKNELYFIESNSVNAFQNGRYVKGIVEECTHQRERANPIRVWHIIELDIFGCQGGQLLNHYSRKTSDL